MLTIIDFFLLLYMIKISFSQELDYELACTNIYYTSKKDCTVAPWHDNYRCCYVTYDINEEKVGECIYKKKKKKALKDRINKYKDEGKNNIKIQCSSNYIMNIDIFIILIFFTFSFC